MWSRRPEPAGADVEMSEADDLLGGCSCGDR